MATELINDIAITSKEQDELGRKNLVDLVVDTIKLKDSKQHPSICIGVYGEWGEGKTSFMKMIKEGLSNEGNVNSFWFNPWSISDQERMTVEFFAAFSSMTLKDAETLPLAISSYGKSFLTPEIVHSNPVLSTYQSHLSYCFPTKSPDLSCLKDYISKKLAETGNHVIVFIDDVDRLQPDEIRRVFKLIYSITDFDNVIYIIGVDPEVVSTALGESFSQDKKMGRDFLKKIVQIPIVLPMIQDIRLQQLFINYLRPLLHDSGISITNKELDIVSRTVTRILKSKRDIIRYVNQLSILLPVLHVETDFVDLCLLESLKLINEQGWLAIYTNKDKLLRKNESSVLTEEEIQSLFEEAVQSILSFYSPQNQDYVRGILVDNLFKKTRNVKVRKESSKKVCDEVYFRQYFICGVPDGVISREDLLVFKKRIQEKRITEALKWVDANAVLYPAAEIERVSLTAMAILQEEDPDTADEAETMIVVLSSSRLTRGFGYDTIHNKNTADFTVGGRIIPNYLGSVVNKHFVVDIDRENKVLKQVFLQSSLHYCMNLFYTLFLSASLIQVIDISVFNVIKDRIIQEGDLEVFKYSSSIKEAFFRVWLKVDKDEYVVFLEKVLATDSFDPGKEIRDWLVSVEERNVNHQIKILTGLYKPVMTILQNSMARSQFKEDSYVRKFFDSYYKFM